MKIVHNSTTTQSLYWIWGSYSSSCCQNYDFSIHLDWKESFSAVSCSLNIDIVYIFETLLHVLLLKPISWENITCRLFQPTHSGRRSTPTFYLSKSSSVGIPCYK